MKFWIRFIVIISFLPIFAVATGPKDSTNSSKYSYNNEEHDRKKQRSNVIKHTKPSKYYAHSGYLDNAYFIKQASIKVEGIDFDQNIDFIYQKYINKQVNNDDLLKITEDITKYFLEKDYLLPQVTINAKDLRKGTLNINVKIESIRDVIFIGETNSLLHKYAKKILEGKPTKISNTQRYLVLLNKIPGYDIQYNLRENIQDEINKKESSIELIITTTKLNGEIFANLDNYGTNTLGKDQLMADAEIFSTFIPGDSLSFTGMMTNHPDELYDVGLNYGVPINNEGTRANFSVSYAEDNITNESAESAVTAPNSHQTKLGLGITHPLYLTATQNLDIFLGTYYNKLVNYDLFSIDTFGKSDSSRYLSIDIGAEYLLDDKFEGHNIIRTSFVQGLDGTYNYYLDPNTVKDKHFNLYKFDAYRQQSLPNNFSLFGHVAVHYSDKNIPDQELFGLGGRVFGRGYEFFTLDGNQLVAFSFETRYSRELEYGLLHELEPYLFYDVGYVGKQSSNTDITNISSTGGGLRFKFDKDINIGLEVAQPLNKSFKVGGEDVHAGTRVNVFINKTFKF